MSRRYCDHSEVAALDSHTSTSAAEVTNGLGHRLLHLMHYEEKGVILLYGRQASAACHTMLPTAIHRQMSRLSAATLMVFAGKGYGY